MKRSLDDLRMQRARSIAYAVAKGIGLESQEMLDVPHNGITPIGE